MPKGFPTCPIRKILRIVEKYADGPLKDRGKGSHKVYQSRINGKKITIGINKKDFSTSLVRKILVKDLGLTEEQARKEVQ